jgi:hypothetical protein
MLTQLGFVLVLLAGYSAHHFRVVADDERLPFDVVLMLFAGLGLTLLGSISKLPEFKSAKGVRQLNSVGRDEFLDRPSFRRVHHRGAALAKRRGIE